MQIIFSLDGIQKQMEVESNIIPEIPSGAHSAAFTASRRARTGIQPDRNNSERNGTSPVPFFLSDWKNRAILKRKRRNGIFQKKGDETHT